MTPYHRLLSLCITHPPTPTHTHTHTHTPTHPHTPTHTYTPTCTHSCSRCAEWELLCLASSLLGQSLVASASGNVATTRRALEAFLDSARYRYTCVVYAYLLVTPGDINWHFSGTTCTSPPHSLFLTSLTAHSHPTFSSHLLTPTLSSPVTPSPLTPTPPHLLYWHTSGLLRSLLLLAHNITERNFPQAWAQRRELPSCDGGMQTLLECLSPPGSQCPGPRAVAAPSQRASEPCRLSQWEEGKEPKEGEPFFNGREIEGREEGECNLH